MSDRIFFSLAALAAIAMILLALVWPQGLGARSPGPFGHPVPKAAEAPAAASKPIDAHAATAAGLRVGQ